MKRAGAIVVAALPLLGAGELGLHFFFASRAPAFDAYASLAPVVKELRHEGDVVIVAPHWADPSARAALGDALMPIREEARPDVSRYAGAIEISVVGQRDPELAAFREEARRDVGKFTVRRLVNRAPANVVYDFTDHVAPASLDVRGTEPEVACTWNPRATLLAGGLSGHPTFPPERFECPGGVFFNVGVTVIADQRFLPRRCIWAHPFSRGELALRFRDVPLGDELRGHAGMYWMTERERRGAPVTLKVRVDGDEVGTYEHRDGEGWKAFDFALGGHARAKGATVEFAVSTRNYRDRHFCFEADTR